MTARKPNPDSYMCLFVARHSTGGWTIHGLGFETPPQFTSFRSAIRVAREHAKAPNAAILILDREILPGLNPRDAHAPVRMVLQRVQKALEEAFSSSTPKTYYRTKGLLVDLLTGTVIVAGHPVRLSKKEMTVLATLVRHAGRVVEHDVLAELVWGPAQVKNRQYLRVLVSALRAKLERGEQKGHILMTERSVGYFLVENEAI
jgi:DNA-binding winged helix-turn-helix (wHTH) protein